MEQRIDTDRLKDIINRMEPDFLPRDGSGKGYVCPNPNCGSGSGPHGTGLRKKEDETGIHYKCFVCDLWEDVLGLWGIYSGTDNFVDKVKGAAEYYKIPLMPGPDYRPARPLQNPPEPKKPLQDFTSYYREAEKHLTETDYLQKRGISLETCRRFHIGYDPKWKNPASDKAWPSPRVIIPQWEYGYLARSTNDNGPYSKLFGGTKRVFNEEALKTAKKPIFVVEGEIDALSIIEAGGEAVGIGGAANGDRLLEALEKDGTTQPLLIALDNDETGKKRTQGLLKDLKEKGYAAFPSKFWDKKYKDANEALLGDREGLEKYIKQAEAVTWEQEPMEEQKETPAEVYKAEHSNAAYLQNFLNGIDESVNTPCVPTGFLQLDNALDRGLYAGLYILGAETSTGKTTFALQVADQIAQQGKDVLFFSLEMDRNELISRSISRHTFIRSVREGRRGKGAKEAREITDGSRYKEYEEQDVRLIANAINDYGAYADHVYVKEGFGDIGVKQIREDVENFSKQTGNTPVVFVDYLQILAPYDVRATDKQNADKAVLELKRISRDFKTPVFVVSSVNRAGYNKKVTTSSYKESGGIEYSGDVLFGFSFVGAGQAGFDEEAAAAQNPREIEIKILKNRSYEKGVKVELEYHQQYFYMEEKIIEH